MIDSCFEISEQDRTRFIDRRIVARLPENVREQAKERATSITNNYIGRDSNALSILAYAAERGRFEEFAGKLEKHCREYLCFVDPGVRRLAIPDVIRTKNFFIQCYQELGIKPRKIYQ